MKEVSDAELDRVAKKLVELEYGRYALGPVKKGAKLLIQVPIHQEERVLNAIKKALLNAGAAEVDVVSEKEVMKWKTSPRYSSAKSWEEFYFFTAHFGYRKFIDDSDIPSDIRQLNYAILDSTSKYVKSLKKKYDAFYAGPGGWTHYKTVVGGPYKSLWPYTNYEYCKLFADFPQEVWMAVEDRIKSLMPQVAEVRVKDEEGTDLKFTMTEEEAKLWREESQPSNHLFMFPRPPSFPDANGFIAGTSNHFGFYPYCKVQIRHGQVVKVEGGGKFGDLWREYLDRFENTQYPGVPEPGYYYIHESALATNPRGFRNPKEFGKTNIFMTNDSERNRAGVLHWGLGLQALDFIERKRPFKDKFDKMMKLAKEKDLPYTHSAHIHNFFLTYEVRLRDSNKWIRLVDKGRITLFDQPEFRELASKYGNPDEIFRYDWVPAVPGISYSGNYFNDFAKDPISWVEKEMKEIMPKMTVKVKEETGKSVLPHLHEPGHGHR
jgi:hypothetical protein